MKDEIFHFQQFDIHQGRAAMKVGTDSDLLGALCAGGSRILDIGTGTGVLSLMLAQRCPEAQITAIEIDSDAVLDARQNFALSPWSDRLHLKHISLQDYLLQHSVPQFDSVVCNPPFFHRSLHCPDAGRTRARHTASLPFSTLVGGAYNLLLPGGSFSVCLPTEVLADFTQLCLQTGFTPRRVLHIKTLPHKAPKRHVLVMNKGAHGAVQEEECCMRNADQTRSDWYLQLMADFLLCGPR